MDDFSLEIINYLGTKGLILFQFSYFYSVNTKQLNKNMIKVLKHALHTSARVRIEVAAGL